MARSSMSASRRYVWRSEGGEAFEAGAPEDHPVHVSSANVCERLNGWHAKNMRWQRTMATFEERRSLASFHRAHAYSASNNGVSNAPSSVLNTSRRLAPKDS
eukprot:CAMPEP_0181248730 /NCGR_PEP_ID=MMETSP1096-20121128/45343_1 /TAXON_ID=156174 ORGANISM="Chrysochromulina ericina, Strain CCMP281" /NCGR_SAMPLE_ID=MMETSP1096 /ASSEMBLY_ACC=CAM_ASM_000453 /LENGTH=101 /DNA_ID=CAMNT_0023345953 /DNA_START=180 /DNA_END=486 /DNA_ORIENTATION=-